MNSEDGRDAMTRPRGRPSRNREIATVRVAFVRELYTAEGYQAHTFDYRWGWGKYGARDLWSAFDLALVRPTTDPVLRFVQVGGRGSARITWKRRREWPETPVASFEIWRDEGSEFHALRLSGGSFLTFRSVPHPPWGVPMEALPP